MPQIVGFEAYRVPMPRERRPESLLVRLTGADGTVGWGEVLYTDECWPDVEERLGPALLGLDWERPEDVAGLAQIAGRPAAAAVDIACWDLWCRGRGTPVAHALGGTRTSVVTGARLPGGPPAETLGARVNRYVGGGYARVTLAIYPGWDLEPVRAIRQAYPTLALHVDANGSYRPSAEHVAVLEALASYGVSVIERPFETDDLAAHAALQRGTGAAVAPDLRDVEALGAAIEEQAGRALNLQVDAFGGLTAARAAHDRAFAAGWDVWCSGPGPFGIGQAAAVAMASLPGVTLPSDVSEIGGGPEFVSPPVRPTGGVVAVPLTQPGLGHDVDEKRITRLASRTLRIPA